MQLQEVLYTQGFGTRRECLALIAAGDVGIAGQACTDPHAAFETGNLEFSVRGGSWRWRALAYLVMNKPVGTECSQRPGAWPSVYSLLPMPLRRRPRRGGSPGVQAAGRLDQDTTGLLLLTDDGALIHRLNSPRRHVPKVYEVTTADPVDPGQLRRLLDGVALDDDPQPVRAVACEQTASHALRLTLDEGRYHQVKRMLGATGNRVTALHRSRLGPLHLSADLALGAWRWLADEEVEALRALG